MAKPKITLYIDTVSPFGYMAYYMCRNSPVFKECDFTYVPIFLGGIFKACGNTAPIQIKNKDKWINLERLRWARLFNIPISDGMPDGFPPLTLTIQRALTALTISHPQRLEAAQDALYKAFWVERNVISAHKPEGLLKVLTEVIGEADAKSVLEKAQQAEAKALLSKRTDEALAEGAFGIPWFTCTKATGEKESFWGFDHIGQVAHFLGLTRPKAESMQEGGWRAML